MNNDNILIRREICIKQRFQAQVCGWILMWETTGNSPFHCGEALLWIMHSYLGQKQQCNDGFVSYKQLLALHKMLTDGLEWCGLLWCFYQTLILTAPIHCRASISEQENATFFQIWWRNKPILDGLRVNTFSANVNLCVNYFVWHTYSMPLRCNDNFLQILKGPFIMINVDIICLLIDNS